MTDALDEENLLPQECSFESRLEQKETAALVLREIETFDGTTQQILRLKLFSEANFPQIAQIVFMPESTVKSRYYTAVKKIQKRLEESE